MTTHEKSKKSGKAAKPGARTPAVTDDAAFHYRQAVDKLCAPHWPGQDRLADGRLILPLMLDLPRMCPLRRCRRSKTCAGPEFRCIDVLEDVATHRAKRLEADSAWMQRRWATITASGGPVRKPRARTPAT